VSSLRRGGAAVGGNFDGAVILVLLLVWLGAQRGNTVFFLLSLFSFMYVVAVFTVELAPTTLVADVVVCCIVDQPMEAGDADLRATYLCYGDMTLQEWGCTMRDGTVPTRLQAELRDVGCITAVNSISERVASTFIAYCVFEVVYCAWLVR
jgi:hypothetical protein